MSDGVSAIPQGCGHIGRIRPPCIRSDLPGWQTAANSRIVPLCPPRTWWYDRYYFAPAIIAMQMLTTASATIQRSAGRHCRWPWRLRFSLFLIFPSLPSRSGREHYLQNHTLPGSRNTVRELSDACSEQQLSRFRGPFYCMCNCPRLAKRVLLPSLLAHSWCCLH
jgi:hypothetical protein